MPEAKTPKTPGTPPVKLDLEEGSLYSLEDSYHASWSGVAKESLFDWDEFSSDDYEEMLRRDGKARTIQKVLTLPIMSASWKIVPGPGDTGEAAKVEDWLTRPANQGGMKTPMRLVIAQALSARTHRKACFEKVFTEKDGNIVYDKLAFRPASTCGLLRDSITGAFRGFQQRPVSVGGEINPNYWIRIPAERAWVHINGQEINPARGHSDMELVHYLHDKKMKVLYLWATFLEVQATGRTIVISDDESQARKYATALRYLKNGGVLGASGENFEVKELGVNGTSAQLFQEFINYCDSQMAESVLAGFTNLTGMAASRAAGGGSYALSKDQSDFFLQSLEASARELAESITHYVIADLVRLNFGDKGVCPTFTFGSLSETNLAAAQALLTAFGTTPTELRVPQAFMTELTRLVGTYLDLPMQEVEKQFADLEKRLAERNNLELEGKKQGLEMQKLGMQQGGPAGAVTAAQGKSMLTAGARVNAATALVTQRQQQTRKQTPPQTSGTQA